LCDALARQVYLNDWGYLDPGGSHDGEAAVALVELGESALEPLLSVLKDERPAPLFGSEPATLSKTYKYRRKDFAYRYISLIRGTEPSFDPDPAVRDAAIMALESALNRLPGK
jgi:HEAT repeat protein